MLLLHRALCGRPLPMPFVTRTLLVRRCFDVLLLFLGFVSAVIFCYHRDRAHRGPFSHCAGHRLKTSTAARFVALPAVSSCRPPRCCCRCHFCLCNCHLYSDHRHLALGLPVIDYVDPALLAASSNAKLHVG